MKKDEALNILKNKGHKNIVEVSFPENHVNQSHTHPFNAEIIIVAGGMKVTIGGDEKNLAVGDQLELAANLEHSEHIGPGGVTYLAARP